MNRLICSGIVLLLTHIGYTHPLTLSARVTDTSGQSIPSVSVTMLSLPDSSWLQSTITDGQGQFSIQADSSGSYLIQLFASGYTPLSEEIIFSTDMDNKTFTLTSGNHALQEVTFKSQKPFLESSLGKTTVNFPTSSIPAGSTLIEILRKSPGVLVDGSGNIMLQGKGVLVLIDDKPTYLSGSELSDFLKSTSAEQVTQIELITQPSGKYDAEGSGGIINIKMKKDNRNGWYGNASLSLSLAQEVTPGTTGTVNLNYHKNGFIFFINAGSLYMQGYLKQPVIRTVRSQTTNEQETTIRESAFMKETFQDYNLKAGADYSFNKNLTAGASIKGILHPNREKDNIDATLLNTSDNSVIYNNGITIHKLHKNSIIANAYMKYTQSKDQTISIDFDYLLRDYFNQQDFTSFNRDAAMNPLPDNLLLKSNMPSNINVYSLRADYTVNLKHNLKIEAGIKSSYVQANNGAHFSIWKNNEWQYDSLRTNDFRYKENINAAYLNLQKKFNNHWEAQIGLRAENTNASGVQLVNNTSFERHYTSLFPTAFIGYKPDDQHSFEINYGKRINRPAYLDLNPFIRYSSQYQYTTGNPFLQPRYEHSLELKYNYKDMFFCSADAGVTYDLINPVMFYDSATYTVINTSINNANNRNLHASIMYSKEMVKWCSITLGLDGFHQEYRIRGQSAIFSSSWTYSGMFAAQLNFDHGWNADIYYQYISQYQQNMTDKSDAWHWLNFNISKKIWKERAAVKLSLEDPFGFYRNSVESNWNNVHAESSMKWSTQRLNIGFTYNFGKKQENAIPRNTIDEAARLK